MKHLTPDSKQLKANILTTFGNIRQASILTGISRAAWYKWIDRGQIPQGSLDLIAYRTTKRKAKKLLEGIGNND